MTIETYAERLQKRKEEKMSNYDMDEIERERSRTSVEIGKDNNEQENRTVEIELADEDILKLALAAHDRDITLNKMCSSIIIDSMGSLDYKFEHQSRPTVLKEY